MEKVGTHYIHQAVQEWRLDVLQAAAAAGVNLKKVRTLGAVTVPLIAFAVYRCQLDAVLFLLDYGVDVNEVFVVGEECVHGTVCDLASERSDPDSERILAALRGVGGKCLKEL